MSEKAASLTSHVEKSVTDEAVNRESVYRNIVHHKVQLYDENGALNLVPTPSSDPNGESMSSALVRAGIQHAKSSAQIHCGRHPGENILPWLPYVYVRILDS